MTRQTSVQITEATDAQVEYLKQRGFGGTTDVIRIAIDRMATQEGHTMTTIDYGYPYGRQQAGLVEKHAACDECEAAGTAQPGHFACDPQETVPVKKVLTNSGWYGLYLD